MRTKNHKPKNTNTNPFWNLFILIFWSAERTKWRRMTKCRSSHRRSLSSSKSPAPRKQACRAECARARRVGFAPWRRRVWNQRLSGCRSCRGGGSPAWDRGGRCRASGRIRSLLLLGAFSISGIRLKNNWKRKTNPQISNRRISWVFQLFKCFRFVCWRSCCCCWERCRKINGFVFVFLGLWFLVLNFEIFKSGLVFLVFLLKILLDLN